MNVNHFVLSGNIARDFELRHLANSNVSATYTVACNSVWFDEKGNRQERAEFIPITTFGKQAERDAQYLRKGSPVTVEGRIESWFNAAEKRGGVSFKARNVEYGGRGHTGGGSDESGPGRSPPQANGAVADAASDEWLQDYIAAEQRSK